MTVHLTIGKFAKTEGYINSTSLTAAVADHSGVWVPAMEANGLDGNCATMSVATARKLERVGPDSFLSYGEVTLSQMAQGADGVWVTDEATEITVPWSMLTRYDG